MPCTINVNMMTVSHAGSVGTSISFPDVCKTPAPPAPSPIPIPYPNVAQSADVMSGSSTVKLDGSSIMLKGANMKLSTGDEAGVAMGVVSNKIKGKAEFVNYSFDVKIDGKNVCRLTDPTQGNMGSANTFALAHVQAPLVVLIPQLEGCKKTDQKQKEQKIDKETAWNNAGIYKGHRAAIQQVANDFGVIIYFRPTNHWCADRGWIPGQHKPKPHEVIAAKTISEKNAADSQGWINGFKGNWKAPPFLPPRAETLYGVVASLETHNKGQPLKGYGSDSNGYTYLGKWITGDYDLLDIMYTRSDCSRPNQDDSTTYGQIKRALNKGMKWDGIQHGPQAQWVQKGDADHPDVNMPKALKSWLKAPANTPVASVPITKGDNPRMLPVCDKSITVVAPKGKVVYLDSEEDVKNALICCGCAGA